jgi:hypothetical protein
LFVEEWMRKMDIIGNVIGNTFYKEIFTTI